jgi:protease-4
MLKLFRWMLRLAAITLAAAGAWYWFHGPSIPSHSYLVLDVSGAFSEAQPQGLLSRLLGRDRSISEVLEALRKVRHDGRIVGVIARIDRLEAGWAQAHEIRSALALVKAGGKKVIAELEVELAPASKEMLVASVADRVYVAPAAAPLLTGLKTHSVFFGGVWPKIDVTMQVEQIREYKTAGDEIARESMSPAQREMLDSILDDVRTHFTRTVSGARNLDPGELDKSIARGLTRPRQMVEAGLADAVRGHGEVLFELGSGFPVPTVPEEKYAGVTETSLGIGDGPTIAVVHVNGVIHRGHSRAGGSSAGSRTIAAALRQAATDSSVSAIVLRVNSPGGSPAASDEIWMAVRDAAKGKPVIASFSDVAASGGYYLASAADRIVSAPGTLTGSIGVVFFKPDVSALLARLGIHTESLTRGRYARLFDMDKRLDDDELQLVRAQLNDTYRLFLERVAEGRHKKPEDIDRVGGGRVWTGQQAFERGLVDEIGGFEDAVRAAANAAGIHDADKVHLAHFPKGENLADQLAEASGRVRAAMQPELVTALTSALGDSAMLLELEPGLQAVSPALVSID